MSEPEEVVEFAIMIEPNETRRGRRVSVEFMDEYRAVLDKLSPSAQMKIAAVAMSYATDMAEITSIGVVERILWVRREFGWTDPDVLRALQPPTKDAA